MKTIYRIILAVDYEGQREREQYYTEKREEAENRYIEAQIKVKHFGEEKGLKVYDMVNNNNYMTTFADGNQKGKPYTGAIAEFSRKEFVKDDFLNLGNTPIF